MTLLALTLSNAGVDARRPHNRRTGLAPIAYGHPAPNFAFDEFAPQGPASLAALRGRPIVINFWAAYCAPCVDELGTFAKLRQAYGAAISFVAVSDQTHDITDAALRAKGIDAISIADPDRKIFGLYGVSPIPVTLVLAPDESVTYVSIGELDWNELHGAIDAVRTLASPPPS
jgi:cytochrome c biogenesis protein CcmG/thiol:disulfide interchange protein DsbE